MTTNQNGNPAIFASTTEAANWKPMLPGEVGTRAAIRLDDVYNTDMAVTKSFGLPWQGQRLQFRAEAFNVFNNVNFSQPNVTQTSASFGVISSTRVPPRILQVAAKISF